MGILIEHYGGAMPVWLAPVQIMLAPVSDQYIAGATGIACELEAAGIRVEVDAASESVGKKVRNAAKQKIPYIVVLGDRELGGAQWTVRVRGQEEQVKINKEEFIQKVRKEIALRS